MRRVEKKFRRTRRKLLRNLLRSNLLQLPGNRYVQKWANQRRRLKNRTFRAANFVFNTNSTSSLSTHRNVQHIRFLKFSLRAMSKRGRAASAFRLRGKKLRSYLLTPKARLSRNTLLPGYTGRGVLRRKKALRQISTAVATKLIETRNQSTLSTYNKLLRAAQKPVNSPTPFSFTLPTHNRHVSDEEKERRAQAV